MSVRKLRNSWWVDFRFKGERHRRRSPLNTRHGAQDYELTLRARLNRGEPIDGTRGDRPVLTFAEFAQEWFAAYATANNKPSEQRNKRRALDGVLHENFGLLHLEKITVAEVEQFKAAMTARGYSAKTTNNYLAILRKCLNSALEWGLLEKVPRIRALRYSPPPMTYLSDAEVVRLLSDHEEPVWDAMVRLALRSGLRLGELAGLRWSDVDFDRGVVTVAQSMVRGIASLPKSNKVRYIPLAPDARAALRALARTSPLVFPRPDGTPIGYHIAERVLDRICKRAQVRHIGWHTLRHTFATQLSERGVPIVDIKELLGHSTIVMTARYAHVNPTTLRGAVLTLLHRAELGEVGQPAVNAFRETA